MGGHLTQKPLPIFGDLKYVPLRHPEGLWALIKTEFIYPQSEQPIYYLEG